LSFFEDEAARRIQVGILQDASLFAGMHVLEVREQHTPAFSGPHRFKVDSPVVVRTRRDDGSREYLTYDNPMSDRLLTRGLQAKMRLAGLGDEHTGGWVRFDRQYRGARTKLATIRKGRHAVRHKASLCPVVVGGTPQAARFAWNVGVGHLTGSGFGALR
jgi:CRISPR-associated endoribonuclease Cas6